MRNFHPSYNLLTLENFQSIKNRTEIPIRPLTFLYGPNSAGKSSILDALSFLEAVFKSDDVVVRQMTERWRHIPNASSIDQLASDMSVNAKFTDFHDIFNEWEGHVRSDLPEEVRGHYPFLNIDQKNKANQLNKFQDIEIETKGFGEWLSIEVLLSGEKILKTYLPDNDGDPEETKGRTNENVYILEIFCGPFDSRLNQLASKHGEFIEGTTSYKTPCQLSFGPLTLNVPLAYYSPFESDLLSIGNFILKCLRWLTFRPPNVDSDRGTISNQCLSSFHFASSYVSKYEGKTTPRLTLAPALAFGPLNKLSHGAVADLAAAKFQQQKEIWIQTEEGKPTTGLVAALVDATRNFENTTVLLNNGAPDTESLHIFVNRCLSEHLFLDQGYQLTYDVCRVFPSDLSGSTNADVFAALIACALIDSAGRSLTFEDVGTGISCVLPVLTALYSKESFIQQPELHLHPALQSALADILVERAKSWEGSARHIIETHSEYLLLRCLRRVRETTLGRQPLNSPLSLSKDDVSVLYFDPQPDGTTTVKTLRVSTQGDFIDRWPRGFFEERATEIFDE